MENKTSDRIEKAHNEGRTDLLVSFSSKKYAPQGRW